MRGDSRGLPEVNHIVQKVRSVNPSVKIKLGTVATKRNLHEIPQLGDAIIESKVKIETWKIYQFTPRRRARERASEFTLLDSEFSELKSEMARRLRNLPFSIVYSSNASRKNAYLFIYPNGVMVVPNVGTSMGDLVIGNVFAEGGKAFDRVKGVHTARHSTNRAQTYPV